MSFDMDPDPYDQNPVWIAECEKCLHEVLDTSYDELTGKSALVCCPECGYRRFRWFVWSPEDTLPVWDTRVGAS